MAVFNFDKTSARSFTLDAARLGLSGSATYSVKELWTGSTSSLTGSTSVSVPIEDVKLYKITG
ncbi:MAG TPA: hypothetical protein VM677_21700 [Actinokineospora sp.]|nr:hypothetical protein [Actinokineospora sp.]